MRLPTLLLLALHVLLGQGFAPSRFKSLHQKYYSRTKSGYSSEEEETTVFAGVRLPFPVSRQLEELNIHEPSPIQEKAILALSTGLSCIIHAETGSGKTLCYLLPLLKRLISMQQIDGEGFSATKCAPLQSIIVVPSRELAIQVAADVASLVSVNKDNIDTRMIHLCIDSGKAGLDNVRAPIVIGTPFKLLDALHASSHETLQSLEVLVLDEVDRMLAVSGKYASNEDRRKQRQYRNPAADLISNIVRVRGFVPPSRDGVLDSSSTSTLQVVAASATIGRPLRRELYHLLLGGGERRSRSAGELPLLQAESTVVSAPLIRQDDESDIDCGGDDEAYSLEDLLLDGQGAESGTKREKTLAGVKQTRRISIPSTIRHVALLINDETDKMSSKTATLQKMWTRPPLSHAKRAILFVPNAEDVQQTIGMLRFMGLGDDVRDLQGQLGIELGRRSPSAGGRAEGRAEQSRPAKKSTREMIRRAALTNLGVLSRLEGKLDLETDGTNDRELFVIPTSGTRGLHIRDVEYVLVTSPPRTMDEYLHVAGRTGRVGNKVPGTVVTLVSYDELKRLQSWQTPLNIKFDVQYETK